VASPWFDFKYAVQRSALGDFERLQPWQLVNYFARTSGMLMSMPLADVYASFAI